MHVGSLITTRQGCCEARFEIVDFDVHVIYVDFMAMQKIATSNGFIGVVQTALGTFCSCSCSTQVPHISCRHKILNP